MKTHLKHLRQVFQRMREADLRLKMEKCNFLKAHLQYLGNIISGKGIEPVPEKLESFKKMPAPTTPKEVKQFLGLIGYYRKFVPQFADIARPLTSLTKKNIEFHWTEKCQASFELLKEALMKEPILRYPNPKDPYILYTDASKYAWACVLTQPHWHKISETKTIVNHPITYVSWLFKGSQLNWAALTKEAYAIYMSIKKLNYYLEDAEIILMCDHLPLKKFLKRNTLNFKVNNWAVELSAHKIEFRYIIGIKNTLADTMSRIIQIDPEIKLQEEEEWTEYGYAVFESLPPIMTKDEINSLLQETTSYEEIQLLQDNDNGTKLGSSPIKNKKKVENKLEVVPEQGNRDNDPIFLLNEDIKIPIEDDKLVQMQRRDKFCKNLLNQLELGKLSQNNPYYIEEGIL